MLRERKEPPYSIPETDEIAFVRQHTGVYLRLNCRVCTHQTKAPRGKALHHGGDQPGLVKATVPESIQMGIGKQHHIVAA
jgi:hypothetical protein